MDPIGRQDHQDDEIWDQQHQVELVGMVKALEGLVGEIAHEARDWAGALDDQQESCDGRDQA